MIRKIRVLKINTQVSSESKKFTNLPLQVKHQDLHDVREMDTARTDLKRTVLQQIEVGVGIIEAGELCWADTP